MLHAIASSLSVFACSYFGHTPHHVFQEARALLRGILSLDVFRSKLNLGYLKPVVKDGLATHVRMAKPVAADPLKHRREWVNAVLPLAFRGLGDLLVSWDTAKVYVGVPSQQGQQHQDKYTRLVLHVGAAITAKGGIFLQVLPPMTGGTPWVQAGGPPSSSPRSRFYSGSDFAAIFPRVGEQVVPRGALELPDGAHAASCWTLSSNLDMPYILTTCNRRVCGVLVLVA